jgi:hypothetical protein
MQNWVPQARGDFFAAFFGMAAMRLLLVESMGAAVAAGAFAGLMTQFKFVFVEAMAAGGLWLLVNRRMRHLAAFAAGASAASVGLFLIIWQVEPEMPRHLLVLRAAMRDFRGVPAHWLKLVQEPGVLLALLALPVVLRRGWRRWQLLVMYAAISFILSSAADVQPGASLNYYYITLFALAPLAGFGVLQFGRIRPATASLLITCLLVGAVAGPQAVVAVRTVARAPESLRATVAGNAQKHRLRALLSSKKVFATVPDVVFLSGQPVVDEPFMLGHLYAAGVLDLGPLLWRIDASEFDLVALPGRRLVYRRIELVPGPLRKAIAKSYRPHCALNRTVYFTPEKGQSGDLAGALIGLGCVPCGRGANCSGW